jgi:hypothetical protein
MLPPSRPPGPVTLRAVLKLAFVTAAFVSALAGEPRYFLTALGGISTLSADAGTNLQDSVRVALYKPENGAAVNAGGGVHLNNWLSAQGSYIWNRNRVTLTQVDNASFFEQPRSSRQHAAVADLLLYFRNRASWARPYLSAGVGVFNLADSAETSRGSLVPPGPLSENRAFLRVAVGIDLMHASGWGFRYSFSESISGNPYSAVLTPRGPRGLANFQNLFGFVKYF